MARTPEGKVKDVIKKFLVAHQCGYYMPVSNGMGAPTLDFICNWKFYLFFIEAKAPGKLPSPRQTTFIAAQWSNHKVKCFVVDGEEALEPVKEHICRLMLIESARSTSK